ncbi:RusA family crossover junction endodeoxyribonuclease [Deinococcus aetherius]|uniref:RusA family crossover junction endodeoxyribonuclease n=1 Tax=Deinococcus aetherius TaxID=200252 RepID=UPI0022300588|nr:RusA family crossover junction endodeoxyribonuclease [Deinococcus aetherius]
MPASPPARQVNFVIPALATWGRSGGRPDPTAPRRAKLVGYYTRGATPNHTRLREYQTWKDHVRAHAPPELRRLRPVDETSRVRLDVVCHFANRTHADPENVRKGVVDALFPGGDKWVYGGHDHPRYDAARPRVEVTVTLFSGAKAAAVRSPAAPPTPAAQRVRAKVEAEPHRPVPPRTTPPKSEAAQRPKKTPPTSPGKAEKTGTKAGKTSQKTANSPERKGLWATLEGWAARLTGQTEQDTGRGGTRATRSGRRGTRRN